MKIGCTFWLILWAVLGALYFYLLQPTELSTYWWLPIVLSLSAVILLANLHTLVSVIKQKIASGKNPSEWREGQLVGISGKIQAIGEPLAAPFSGRPAVIVEYDVKRTIQSSDGQRATSDFMGMLMTPCKIYSRTAQIGVVGFPILAQIYAEPLTDPEHYERAVQYLKSTEFKVRSKNPIALLKELNSVLRDDDGTVKADFKEAGASLPLQGQQQESEEGPEVGAEEFEDDDTKEFNLKDPLSGLGYALEEKIVAQNAEVTLFGTYRAAKRAIDIGGGLENLSHQLHLGSIEVVIARQLKKTLLALLFWGFVAIAAHAYVANQLGYPLGDLMKLIQHKFSELRKSE